jgi:pantoate--beta-alanine ligase
MSSRNSYITQDERPRVTVLKQVLEQIASKIDAGEQDFASLESEAKAVIKSQGFKADYVTISNSKTLKPAAINDSDITVLGAMYTKSARLIDNISLRKK